MIREINQGQCVFQEGSHQVLKFYGDIESKVHHCLYEIIRWQGRNKQETSAINTIVEITSVFFLPPIGSCERSRQMHVLQSSCTGCQKSGAHTGAGCGRGGAQPENSERSSHWSTCKEPARINSLMVKKPL